MSVANDLNAWRSGILADVNETVAKAIGSIRAPARVVDVVIVLGGRGTVLATGQHLFMRLGLNGGATVLTWSLAATTAGVARVGAVTLDVQVGATLATVASIAGTGRPALAAQSERSDQLPTGWTAISVADPSWLFVTVTAADGVLEVVGLTLRFAVSSR